MGLSIFPFGKAALRVIGCPSSVFSAKGRKSTFPQGKANPSGCLVLRNGQDRSLHSSLRGRKPVAIRKKYGFFTAFRMIGNPSGLLGYPSSTAASGGPPVLLRYPKYSAACALNILTAAPNPARCFAHWARFAGFALWEG